MICKCFGDKGAGVPCCCLCCKKRVLLGSGSLCNLNSNSFFFSSAIQKKKAGCSAAAANGACPVLTPSVPYFLNSSVEVRFGRCAVHYMR